MIKESAKLLVFILLATACSSLYHTTETPEQEENQAGYYNEDYMRFHDFTYRENIKTARLHKAGFALSMPAIRLGSDDHLVLSFDDLDADIKQYHYELIHCDANWKRSDLNKHQYSEGFETGNIDNYDFSYNTVEDFTNYTLRFPKENEPRPTISGNYIIKVFLSGNREQAVITQRFMVFESKVSITAEITKATPASRRYTHQEVNFSIQYDGYSVVNPEENIKVMIMKNQRWDKMLRNIKPRSIRSGELDYHYDGKLVFSGLNEFRFFDTRSLKHQAPRIEKLYHDSIENHVKIKPDRPKTFENYTSVEDINGKFYITSYDVNREKALESDYTWVHLSLLYNNPMEEGSVYVIGAMSNWQFLEKNKMKYNHDSKRYESSLYLKQGYYNYHYVFLPNNSDRGDASIFEGQHYETENNYTIFVYHRPPGGLYDKLIAVERINSKIN
ncbi:MAG: DUF5103 domain-containing protein [Bacteroidales bacterium]